MLRAWGFYTGTACGLAVLGGPSPTVLDRHVVAALFAAIQASMTRLKPEAFSAVFSGAISKPDSVQNIEMERGENSIGVVCELEHRSTAAIAPGKKHILETDVSLRQINAPEAMPKGCLDGVLCRGEPEQPFRPTWSGNIQRCGEG